MTFGYLSCLIILPGSWYYYVGIMLQQILALMWGMIHMIGHQDGLSIKLLVLSHYPLMGTGSLNRYDMLYVSCHIILSCFLLYNLSHRRELSFMNICFFQYNTTT